MKKNIIVTGGAQGIGKIITEYLLAEGYFVSVFEKDKEALNELEDELVSENLLAIHCDVSNKKDVKKAVAESVDKTGSVFGLINNAGFMIRKPISELSLDEWNSVIGTNLTGTFLCSKYAATHLKIARGSIINMCSTRAFQSEPDTESYSASKGGIFALTHALAMSLGPEIRVNSISPGWIDVSGVKKKLEANQLDLKKEWHEQHPAGRIGKGDDIAKMVLFLLKPDNSFITGQNFTVDGGMTRKMIYV
ncbi:NAD(P)-dependent dehydrogenase, short-chain alcohol dehydrogenase family [Tangfeifania diversioriginum]|uniref:NAD(P)-dependent dehydrogenase, short-chain alcohol dehydrogenase family n=1 Tax=Tangfeifania diversioriginum TaxID=1168035 RepID=A0A1M6E5G3_9BACT|nr:SDR family oxidoreductase [Tangfeifania diversioriginum]SHI80794.1 NAD(P)-dependent dehydrogenase, short-chain alcohol dehydrogenase family [Tangfeifania diversioriginum]